MRPCAVHWMRQARRLCPGGFKCSIRADWASRQPRPCARSLPPLDSAFPLALAGTLPRPFRRNGKESAGIIIVLPSQLNVESGGNERP